MKYIVKNAVFMYLEDNTPIRKYLCFIQILIENEEKKSNHQEWIPLMKKDFEGNQANQYLIEENELYKAIYHYSYDVMGNPSYSSVEIRTEKFNGRVPFIMEDGSSARFSQEKVNASHLISYLMNILLKAEPIDEYIYAGWQINLGYKDGEVSVKMRILSSDILEKELYEKGADGKIIGIMAYFSSDEYFSHINSRFLVKKEEYFVIRLKNEYFLYDSYGGVQKTRYIIRAAKFYSEEEALNYALEKIRTFDLDSFEIEKITERPAYIRRCLHEGDNFEDYSRKIEDSYPYMTVYGCEEPPF